MSDARLTALRVIGRVFDEDAYADRALIAETQRAGLDARDRALAAFLATGTIQRRRTIDHLIIRVAGRDPETLERTVRNTLRLGVFQLVFSAVAPHAAVATSVDLIRAVGVARATGLVNAVLRRVAAEGAAAYAALPDTTPQQAAIRRSYPDWIASVWWDAYGATTARGLMDAGNAPAEVALRIRPGARGRVIHDLHNATVAFHDAPDAPDAVVLDTPFAVADSAPILRGDAAVMSRASQRVTLLVDPQPGMRLLDACAAPGGKALHLADLAGNADQLVCVEKHPKRAQALRATLDRYGAGDAQIVTGDVTALAADLGSFDAILLDAPCSGLGVINARADLRWRRTLRDAAALADQQARMLDALLGRLAPGGRLVYSVCTLNPDENERRVDGLPVTERLVTWPHRGDGAGFYAARIEP